MAVYKQPKSKYWWYKFTWNGEPIRQSTKQSNKRVAEQMEAAHRTALGKGEVGIRERKPVPALKDFAEHDFLPFVRSTFSAKEKTWKYYEYGVKSLLAFEKLASARLDAITTETIGSFVAARKDADAQISSINRELQSLRRMFHLAQEWGKVEKALPTVADGPRREPPRTRSYCGGGGPILRGSEIRGHESTHGPEFAFGRGDDSPRLRAPARGVLPASS